MSRSRPSLLQKLGIKYPIIQSPMAGVSTPAMAASVTNTGGLGSLPISTINFILPNSITQLQALIDSYNSNLVDDSKTNTINLNFFCHEIEQPPMESQILNWKKLYLEATNLPKSVIDEIECTKNGNVSFREFEQDSEALDRLMSYLLKYRPKIISFHFGIPQRSTIDKLKQLGIMVFITATSVEEVNQVIKVGGEVDGVVLQGYEAGGHRGNFLTGVVDAKLPTWDLFQSVKKELNQSETHNKSSSSSSSSTASASAEASRLPPYLVVAGGIMNSSQAQRFLDAGADAVQLGTAFLGTVESNTSGFFSKISQDGPSTVMTALISGKPARAVVTDFIARIEEERKSEKATKSGAIKNKDGNGDGDGDVNVNVNIDVNGELPPYGYAYAAYKQLKDIVGKKQQQNPKQKETCGNEASLDLGFYLAGSGYKQIEKAVGNGEKLTTQQVIDKLISELK
ncbi:hypothetical protein PVL30_005262 [Lodderomyces elongisporus]|uniref:uncharacterized protein n=1 Tax=Lodderomyces elongisporus TaxID=36914 RepID=UPI002921872E|nr:uncharacterized protein PVL30_005262 [Lodderomyces elongisporus]WLF81465.1 hypothetical protein PVL30_005262 [Lodderomyces elongisporus]